MINCLIFLILALIPSISEAKLVQFIHTNDLHSFFDGTRTGKGGYAKIKTKITELRAEGKKEGFTTLHLDGGDFGEGSTFFLSEQGVTSLEMLDYLGVDISVIGNHDFMLGGPVLSQQMNKANLKAAILSANLKNKNKLQLEGIVKDFIDINLDGIKLRVFGLTTDQIHFQYPIKPLGKISSSHRDCGLPFRDYSRCKNTGSFSHTSSLS